MILLRHVEPTETGEALLAFFPEVAFGWYNDIVDIVRFELGQS